MPITRRFSWNLPVPWIKWREIGTVRSLVIHGAGNRSFCAGADLEEMQIKDYSDALNLKSSKVFAAIASYPKVTVAAINGAAVAGGLELALACDIRICSEQARFFFPETKLGLIPAAGGTHRLSQVVGIGRAKELILGGGSGLRRMHSVLAL